MVARESGIALVGDMKSASVVDWGGDGKPGLAVTLNNGATASFENKSAGRWLRVALPGARAAGARVALRRAGLPDQVVELHAGGGYLAQDGATAWFGLGDSGVRGKVSVTWADGTATELPFDGKTTILKATPAARSATR